MFGRKSVNLFDYINAQEMAAYIQENPLNAIPYLGETLFPSQKQLGTDISWLKASNGLPIAIQPSNYDAKARLREKEGFEGVSTEMAFFREAMRIGEKDRQQLNMLMNHPQASMAMPIINKIFDEASRIVEGVRVQAEIMRMQLLTTGKIDVTSADGRAKYVYDYQQQNQFNANIAWGEEGADPIADITEWLDAMELKRGSRPTRLIMNRNTFVRLMACDKLHKMMYPNDLASNMYVSDVQKQQFIEQTTGVKIAVYSKQVALLDHATGLAKTQGHQLIPDGVVCVLPEGNLGKTWYGTTPEESDLMSGSDAQVSIVNGGTAITTYKEPHPVQVVTVVSAVMIPSFEAIDDCAIAHV